MDRLVCTEHGIQLLKGEQKGVFFSRVLDSGEKETLWHRMTCEIPVFRTGVRFWVYAAETKQTIWNGAVMSIDDVLFGQLPAAEKRKILSPFLKKEFLNETDVLLHDIKGRYIWFCHRNLFRPGRECGDREYFSVFSSKKLASVSSFRL